VSDNPVFTRADVLTKRADWIDRIAVAWAAQVNAALVNGTGFADLRYPLDVSEDICTAALIKLKNYMGLAGMEITGEHANDAKAVGPGAGVRLTFVSEQPDAPPVRTVHRIH